MSEWLKYLCIALIGYALGNISIGILVARAWGVKDIRNCGSGNAGSTNVLRTLGWTASILTLAGDCGKAYLASMIGKWIAGDMGLLVGGLFCIIGHDFPVMFSFRGGKGVASTLGLAFAIHPLLGPTMLCINILIVAITRYMSIASLACAVTFPICTALWTIGHPNHIACVIAALIASLLSTFCHRKNIERLAHHAENRLDFDKISRLSKRFKIRFRKEKEESKP